MERVVVEPHIMERQVQDQLEGMEVVVTLVQMVVEVVEVWVELEVTSTLQH
jgi:hypothetical protein